MKTFAEYLAENLIDVDKSDIDKLYAPMKKIMKDLEAVWNRNLHRLEASDDPITRKAIARTMSREFREAMQQPAGGLQYPLRTFHSSELKSENAKIANSIIPVDIHVWLTFRSNQYTPGDKKIHICLPENVLDTMLNGVHLVPRHLLPSLRAEVSDLKHKASIRHELTHWMDDAMHNLHLSKSIETTMALISAGKSRAAQQAYKRMTLGKHDDIYMTHIEVTPMVNQIAEYKRRVSKKQWDSMTWKDLMVALPSLGGLNYKHGEPWRRIMFDRLAREGLIGKSFTKDLQSP